MPRNIQKETVTEKSIYYDSTTIGDFSEEFDSNGIFLPKLFQWSRKKMKFKAEGQEFAKFIQTVKSQINY